MRIFYILLLCSISASAQHKFLEIPNDLKQGQRFVQDAFAVVNETEHTFAIFIDDNKTLNGYLYNQNLEQLAKYASDGLPNRYNQIIGQTIRGNQIRLYLTNATYKKFGTILFDFDTGKSIETEFDFKLKKDRFLQSHSYDDHFYILTVDKRASVLNVYDFDHKGEFKTKSFDFTDKPIRNYENRATTLYRLFTEHNGFESIINVVKIDETNPNSIDITSKGSKFYDRKDSFVLTLDEGKLFTYIFEFKLPEIGVNFYALQKPQLEHMGENDKNNSFLFGDKLFQISGSQDELAFSVKNIHTKEELKNISLGPDDDLSFKNTPILQEGGGIFNPDRVREMEKTSKFMRKISTGDIGVAVIPFKSGYQVTIGGEKPIGSGAGALLLVGGMAAGVPIVTAGAYNMTYNPVYFAYNSYSATQSIRIECLFDEFFNHIEGDVPENPFTEIRAFSDKIKFPKAENVFKLQDNFIYGVYNADEQRYTLTKFD